MKEKTKLYVAVIHRIEDIFKSRNSSENIKSWH